MKPKTELFLYHCLWVAEIITRPTWRNFMGSFEEWAYRNGLLRQLRKLEEAGWIESQPGADAYERLYRLTRKGLLQALGGCDPCERWDRPWDGQWRMVVFDLPERQRSLRNDLRKQLRAARFGCLQGSVWISPDPLEEVARRLKDASASCHSLTMFAGTPCGGESNYDLVTAAWDFGRINQLYTDYRDHLKQLPRPRDGALHERLLDWGRTEKALWSDCLAADPLLPRPLWPDPYPGHKAWEERLRALRHAGQLASRHPVASS